MASYILFDSLYRLVENKQPLTHSDKIWLIDTINNELYSEGKDKLYALLMVYGKLHKGNYDQTGGCYDIEQLPTQLQNIWFEFTKMHLKCQKDDKRRKHV
jgi:hypothetical protein